MKNNFICELFSCQVISDNSITTEYIDKKLDCYLVIIADAKKIHVGCGLCMVLS